MRRGIAEVAEPQRHKRHRVYTEKIMKNGKRGRTNRHKPRIRLFVLPFLYLSV
jgi:hypothetical protein